MTTPPLFRKKDHPSLAAYLAYDSYDPEARLPEWRHLLPEFLFGLCGFNRRR